MPNLGPVTGKEGYRERDLTHQPIRSVLWLCSEEEEQWLRLSLRWIIFQLDPTYKQQSAFLTQAKKDYLAQQLSNKTFYDTNYTYDTTTMANNRKAAFGDNQNDYAARGMMNSGLYADALTKHNNEWTQKRNQLDLARRQYIAGQASDLTNFSAQQKLTETQAKQEAAARRALKLGI